MTSKFFQFFKNFYQEILNILFPPICLNCQKNLSENQIQINWPLCLDCFQKIPINNGFYCPFCYRRLPEFKKSCHQKVKYLLAAVSSYQNPITQNLIHSLKYQSMKTAINPIKHLIALYLKTIDFNFENFIIIPIPLHKKKQRKRGFNQAFLIAQALQEILIKEKNQKLTLENEVIKKIKNTPSQTKIENYKERERNVANCFSIENPEIIKNKNIILVDDVITSGATINEAVKLMKKFGAKKIIAFVLAKSH